MIYDSDAFLVKYLLRRQMIEMEEDLSRNLKS
jgi:hypothetical protein